jgi:hypothetical protein
LIYVKYCLYNKHLGSDDKDHWQGRECGKLSQGAGMVFAIFAGAP